jgi:hypothetical protein
LIGSDKHSNYTGFYKKEGRFFPSEFITIEFAASSALQMKYKLTGNIKSDVEGIVNGSALTNKLIVKVNPTNKNQSLLNLDNPVNIKLTITDEAGNTNEIESTIRYISRLFRTLNYPLVPASSAYKPRLYASELNTTTAIEEKRISNTEYTRSWNEIWYPSTHGSPLT